MSDLDNVIKVTISRETQTISRAGFGVPAIISEFSTAKTSPVFTRHRYYASLTEMTDDGWTTFDREYKAAQIIFNQSPKVPRIMIGRKASGDADLTAALTAIQTEQADWYTFMVIATKTAKILFDIDFEAGNLIDITINGVAVTQVPFNADQATTMGDIETQIEADIANSTVTVSAARELTIDITDTTPSISSIVVSGGGNQAVGAISFDSTGVNDDYKLAAAWSETQVKIFFYCVSDADVKTAVDTDIWSFMQNLNYDRTAQLWHPNSQTEEIPSFLEAGQMGEALPFDPGSQNWKFKTIVGVASYGLTSTESSNMIGTIDDPTGGKNGNVYTSIAGIDIIQNGQVASGEYIDVIRGLDWLKARLQENLFALFTSDVNRKVPYTDGGIQTVVNNTEGTLNDGAEQGIIVKEDITITAPLAKDVSAAQKAARNLPNILWGSTLQGAINTAEIEGTVVL